MTLLLNNFHRVKAQVVKRQGIKRKLNAEDLLLLMLLLTLNNFFLFLFQQFCSWLTFHMSYRKINTNDHVYSFSSNPLYISLFYKVCLINKIETNWMLQLVHTTINWLFAKLIIYWVLPICREWLRTCVIWYVIIINDIYDQILNPVKYSSIVHSNQSTLKVLIYTHVFSLYYLIYRHIFSAIFLNQ